jgi:hypothetical protein
VGPPFYDDLERQYEIRRLVIVTPEGPSNKTSTEGTSKTSTKLAQNGESAQRKSA